MADEAREPLNLDFAEKSGATRFGVDVVRMALWCRDGRRVTMDLPGSEPATDSEEDHLNRSQERILKILRTSPVSMTRQAVAKAMGRESIGGKFSGDVRLLVSLGLVCDYNGELSDSPKKFKEA